MKKNRVVKGVFAVVLAGETLIHPSVHTETAAYVPTAPIVYNGGQVATSTASALLIR